MIIEAGRVVELHFTLYDDDGAVLSSSVGEASLTYLHGHHEFLPGFERAVEGATVGQTLSFSVEPEEGYGLYDPQRVIEVPRSVFPNGDEISIGWIAMAEDEEGNRFEHRVIELDDTDAKLDGNHPLAGKVLHYDVEILNVREATEKELQLGVYGRVAETN